MVKNYLNRQIAKKFHTFIYEIDVTENDGDNRFRSGSIKNVESAHAQGKMAQSGCKCFPIVEIFNSYFRILEFGVAESKWRRQKS